MLPRIRPSPAAALLSLSFLMTASPAVQAQEPLQIPLVTGPIQLDGLSDEPAWQAVPALSLVMHQPTFGASPTERTEVRIAHDGEYLYLAARMYDSDPDGIRATSLRRNDPSLTNDWVALQLDTAHDGENALVFAVSPAGVRTDIAYNDVRQTLNFDWNTFWDAEVQRTRDGWFAEIRIPFSSLRFTEVDGRVTMGMSVFRNIARKSELATFPAIRPDWGPTSRVKPSEMQVVVLEGVRSRTPLYLFPYAMGGASFTSPLDPQGTGYLRDHRTAGDVGMDAKFSLTSNLTLDLTYNTDFAQIEADDQQVNLTRFPLFFPEKRQFFQERSSLFDFPIGGFDRLFHSRQIGLSQGEPVPLHGGGRVVGRIGNWDVGVLNMQAAATEGLASENLSVVRVQRPFLNDGSTVGGIVTSRLGHADNVVYALDALVNVRDQDYLTLNWGQSFSDGEGDSLTPMDRSLVRARWERRGVDGFRYAFDAARSGSGFVPGLGYQQRRNNTILRERISYGWRPGPESLFLRYAVVLQGGMFIRNEDRLVETVSIGPEATLSLKSGHTYTLGINTTYEDVQADFSLAPTVTVPAGRYHFQTLRSTYSPSQGSLLRTSASVEAGHFFDGWRVSADLSPTWNASPHVEMSGTYQFNRVRFGERDQELTAHVARLRARLALNTRLSGAAFVQYNSAANGVFVNARIRYNPREGNDLYLVFNESLVTDRFGFFPERPRTDNRALMVKYVRALTIGF